jgi:hypothetical protein
MISWIFSALEGWGINRFFHWLSSIFSSSAESIERKEASEMQQNAGDWHNTVDKL